MSISANYPSPVQVNGFSCKNCTDVGYAKKHIDPAHPRSGPYDVNVKDDPSQSNAVRLGDKLSAGSSAAPGKDATATPGYSASAQSVSAASDTGQQLDTMV